MTKPTRQDRRAFKRTPRKPAKRKPFRRWTTKCEPDGWTIGVAFDGECVCAYDAAKLLNRARVVLPKTRRKP